MTIFAIIGRAMRRALQSRLLVVSPIVLLVASAATFFALASFLGGLLDHSPRWEEITTSLDSAALVGLIKAIRTPAAAGVGAAAITSLVLAVLFAPLLAGAALVVAESDARPRLRALLAGAAGYYPRLLRMEIAALLPLGVAAIIAALAFGYAKGVSDQATSDAATNTSGRIAWAITLLAVFVGQLVVDAGRARLAVEPARRSALFALGAGAKLIIKRPLQALSVGAASAIAALLVAAVLLVMRQHIVQSSGAAIWFAFFVGQLAVAAVAWGHAAKLSGLVEIARELVGESAAPRRAVTNTPLPTAVVVPSDGSPRSSDPD